MFETNVVWFSALTYTLQIGEERQDANQASNSWHQNLHAKPIIQRDVKDQSQLEEIFKLIKGNITTLDYLQW